MTKCPHCSTSCEDYARSCHVCSKNLDDYRESLAPAPAPAPAVQQRAPAPASPTGPAGSATLTTTSPVDPAPAPEPVAVESAASEPIRLAPTPGVDPPVDRGPSFVVRFLRGVFRLLAKAVAVAAIVVPMARVTDEAHPLWLAVSAATISGWALFNRRHDPYRVIGVATVHVYLALTVAGCILVLVGGSERAWRIFTVVAITNLVVRTFAQELYLHRHGGTRTSYGVKRVSRVSVDEVVRNRAPAFFRWVHRGCALWFLVGFLGPEWVGDDPTGSGVGIGIVLVGFGCILAGPYSLAVLLLGNVLSVVFFLRVDGAIIWAISNFAWFYWSGITLNTDRRTNHRRAFWQTAGECPWKSWA